MYSSVALFELLISLTYAHGLAILTFLIEKFTQTADSQIFCEKASWLLESELNEWAAFQLDSIRISIDFQYGTVGVRNLVRK